MDPQATTLHAKVIDTLHDPSLDDRTLLSEMEKLAASDPLRFPGFSHLWAPALYRRNRNLFRSFLLVHHNAFGGYGYYDDKGNVFNPWLNEETKNDLQALLEQYDTDNEVKLFRTFYEESISGDRKGGPKWRSDLLNAFQSARDDQQRRIVLEKYDISSFILDEPTAVALYRASPSLTTPLLLAHAHRHSSWGWGKRRSPWDRLRSLAAERGDTDFETHLFRLQASDEQWAERTRTISTLAPAKQRVELLNKIHPSSTPKNAAEVFLELLEKHGSDVLPYILKHLTFHYHFLWFHSTKGLDKLIRLAWDNNWLTLWAGLLRNSDQAAYNRAIKSLLEDRAVLGENEIKRRLLLLAGVGQEMNFPGLGIALLLPLTEENAMAMYGRFPEIVRTSFRHHVMPNWTHTHEKLLRTAIDAHDDILVDWFASRVITMIVDVTSKNHSALIKLLTESFESLLAGTGQFARRAGAILSAIPAGVIGNYDFLLRNNALARLFFEKHVEEYLKEPEVVRDFLESPQIHVNQLGFRMVARKDPRSAELGQANLDLLCAALLRKLHRSTRILAIDALIQAVGSEKAARTVLPKARAALRLPDKRYPKEKLLDLIATMLHQHPCLRSECEHPRVFFAGVQP